MKLTEKQLNVVYYLKNKKTKEIIYGGAAGGGKSVIGCLWLIEQCQKYPETRWLMGRAKLKTLKETTLNTFFEISSKLNISNQYNYNAQSSIIHFKNGSEILLKDLFFYPSDPNFDELGSLELSGAFIDECNQTVYKCWQIVQSRIRYKLKDYNLTPKILGTCNPSKGWVYDNFYKAQKNGDMKPSRAFVQALPKDNPHLPESYLQSLLGLDPISRERLYYGNWEYDDNPNALIKYDKILEMFSNDFVEGGDKYIVADIARFGKDKTVIGLWNGLRLEQITAYKTNSVTEAATFIDNIRVREQVPLGNILVDDDGVGGGVRDILKCKPFVNNSSPIREKNYKNLKVQCNYKLSEFANQNKIYICESEYKDLIIQELEWLMSYKVDDDTKLKTMPKEMIKEKLGRSPDFLDMLSMRMYYTLKGKFDF